MYNKPVSNRPDRDSNPETGELKGKTFVARRVSPDLDKATRIAYLESLAIAFGLDAGTASTRVETIYNLRGSFTQLDYSSSARENPHQVEIREVGLALVEGTAYETLSFPVGGTILAMLKEDVNSGYFSNIASWVGLWSDGTASKPFKQALKKRLP